MAIFSIQLPDGRVADIEAGDEASALRGAREWHAENPKQMEKRPSQGLMAEAGNLFTGNLDTEHPEAPEFQKAVMQGGISPEAAAAMPKGRDPQTLMGHVRRALGSTEFDAPEAPGPPDITGIMRSAITSDPAAQVDILKNNIPDLETRQDKFGNVMLRSKALGVNDWSYLNRPGMSARDLDEVGTQTLATLPFGGALGMGRGLLGRVCVFFDD